MHISRSSKKNIIITMGDPSGVGPEVIVKALASSSIKGLANFFIIGDASVIEKAARACGVKASIPVLDLGNVRVKDFRFGKKSPDYGRASLEYIDTALEFLKNGIADALVTAPINKSSINSFLHMRNLKFEIGNLKFKGHTEYLAERTGTKNFAMMFVGKRMKITLVTRHMALKDAVKKISKESISNAIGLTHKNLTKYFGVKHPRIGVAGINPHAGEDGLFGDEEERIIKPAVHNASKRLGGVYGPIPPDVLFNHLLANKFDAGIAMYHDQGLIPFKLLYFKDGVNMTLGLPFIRTSPDHGTAFDIAGKGAADPTSMIEAIKLAVKLS